MRSIPFSRMVGTSGASGNRCFVEDRQHPPLARLRRGQETPDVVEIRVDVAPQGLPERRGGVHQVHDVELHSRLALHVQHRQVVVAADPGGGGLDLLRPSFGVLQEILQGLVRALRPNEDGARVLDVIGHRLEVLHGEGRLPGRVEDGSLELRHIDQRQGIAIRLGVVLEVGPHDLAARARLVLHQDGLPDDLLQGLGQNTDAHVTRPAGAESNHDGDGPVREILRLVGRPSLQRAKPNDKNKTKQNGRQALQFMFLSSSQFSTDRCGVP